MNNLYKYEPSFFFLKKIKNNNNKFLNFTLINN